MEVLGQNWGRWYDVDPNKLVFSASLSISIASGALMVWNIRLDHLSVGLSAKGIVAKRLIESGCHLG